MNHQGGRTGQFNRNANIQNEGGPHLSIAALQGLLPSSSSLAAGSDQRFPDRLSEPNILPYQESANIVPTNNGRSAGLSVHESIGAFGLNISSSSSHTGSAQRFSERLSGSTFLHYQGSTSSIAQSNDRSTVVLSHRIDSTAEHVENNHFNNQNLSLGLSLHPCGSQNQSASSSSALNAINSGGPGYVVEEQGVDGSSANTIRLPFKRRSTDHAFREFLIGESSSTGAQAGIPKRRDAPSQVNANNNVNISTFCNDPENSHPGGDFEAGIGHGTIRSVSDMQHVSEAGQTESFQSNIHLQTAADPQAFVPTDILSAGYARETQVPLPSQPPLFCQYDHLPFFSSSETAVGATSSVHPFEHAPNFREALQASPWNNMMRARNAPPASLPDYSVIGNEAIAPFRNPRTIPRNNSRGPQIGRRNLAHNPSNLRFANGTANFVGNAPHPSHDHGSFPGTNLSNAPAFFPRFNFHEHHMQISSGIVNHPVAQAIAFPRQSIHDPLDSDPSEISQEMDLTIAIGNSRPENEHGSVARSENQAGGNSEPHITLSSLASSEMRSRLAVQVRNALEHIRAGRSLRFEELMILDYSMVLHMLEVQNNREREENNEENGPYGGFVVEEEENDDVDMGLSEEEILMYIRHENFHTVGEVTPENKEACCICQEDFINGEELARLDCVHRFHVECIKQWLVLKNICPICKQTALAVYEDDE